MTRGMKHFTSKSMESDKKKPKIIKKKSNADKMQSKVEKNTSIEDLLKICRPLTVVLSKCKEIEKIRAQNGEWYYFCGDSTL